MSEDSVERENRKMVWQSAAEYEIAVTQMRFQTLSIFIAAIGFIIGLGHLSRSVGALLLLIAVGLWVIDLRNRDMLVQFRQMGTRAEGGMLPEDLSLFRVRQGPADTATFGLLNAQWTVRGRKARLVAFQVGIDIVFLAVIGYAISLLLSLGNHPWLQAAVVFIPLVAAALVAAYVTRRDTRSASLAGESQGQSD